MNNQGRGRFVTFEGIDGAGKSSHIEAAGAWWREQGHRVLLTREPGGTRLAESLLVFAARRDHMQQSIEPALASGVHVICDRFTDATFAYQGGGRGFDVGVLTQLETWVQQGLQPDLTLWFQLSPALAAQRRSAVRAPDRFEAQDIAFFERVQAAYEARAQAQPNRFARIDAAQPAEAVRANVLASLRRFSP